jgi:hypothetical protein
VNVSSANKIAEKVIMRKYFVPVCGLILLASQVGAAAQSPVPNPTSGYDWAIRIDEEGRTRPAILAFEVADTDDQPLNFSCEEGSGRIFAGIAGVPDDLTEITLVSGNQTLQLAGKTDQDEMPSFTSNGIAGDSSFIEAFATNGWLRMTAGGHETDMAGSLRGAKAISAFVAHCNRPRP